MLLANTLCSRGDQARPEHLQASRSKLMLHVVHVATVDPEAGLHRKVRVSALRELSEALPRLAHLTKLCMLGSFQDSRAVQNFIPMLMAAPASIKPRPLRLICSQTLHTGGSKQRAPASLDTLKTQLAAECDIHLELAEPETQSCDYIRPIL
eukprot:jgi/Ulvmu1/11407/UM075_0069.1